MKKNKAEEGDSVKRADLRDRGTRKGFSEQVSFEKKFGSRKEGSHGQGPFQRESSKSKPSRRLSTPCV